MVRTNCGSKGSQPQETTTEKALTHVTLFLRAEECDNAHGPPPIRRIIFIRSVREEFALLVFQYAFAGLKTAWSSLVSKLFLFILRTE